MRKHSAGSHAALTISALRGRLERRRRNRRLISLLDSLDAKYGPVEEALVAKYSELLEGVASRPSVDEVLDRIGRRSGGRAPSDDVVRQLREERDSR